jgi:3-hydroxyacyl-CoA dehydrogenase/3a,7a,12a-trihydroxy-5b-cholest-24-enoyl-CoA hydratase
VPRPPQPQRASRDYEPTADDVFAVDRRVLEQNPDSPARSTTYLWKIGGRRWTLDLKGAGSVKAGGDSGECTLELTEDDFLALTQGKADAMKLFTTGKLKISGNVMASQKLQFLSKLDPSMAIEVIAKRRGRRASRPAAAAAAPAAPARGPGSEDLRGADQASRRTGPRKRGARDGEVLVDGNRSDVRARQANQSTRP